jgi:hypothetical protein
MKYNMRYVRGHVEVFDLRGRFILSADSETEAEREISEMDQWVKPGAEPIRSVYMQLY